ncbi:hypothetical protein SAMN02745126_04399 [Enhydrobacter aerosaccus]|uniref:Uncharacterized protein n=1 Tax=Enhydrobacter aerosaccus TaxID=225324 RepID=A0A1T4S908_9HYPH|nr:hypothetical protein [Enhydrobacter aerosaccus]SKA24388.1 hypothetical protein SAMN02745126_04399 [Enhydrobacter aerosaccus]
MSKKPEKATIKARDFAELYAGFRSNISRFDCGRKCAPLNGGSPLCCSTQHAVPVVHKVEFEYLKPRTDIWTKFKPYDYATRQIVNELTSDCMAIECKGARFCERDNRTIACRGFPFYPYLTRQKEFVGLGTYWVFEDRCWMMSNIELVDKKFVQEFVATYESIFKLDPSEFTTYVDFSATARRVYSRWKREIPLLSREGKLMIVEPSTGNIRPGTKKDYPKITPFNSDKAYRAAIKEAGGEYPKKGLRPE